MPYVDISTLQSIATGQPFAAATLQQIRDNEESHEDPKICVVYNTVVQSIPTPGTAAVLLANAELADNDSMHSTTTNTGRITINTAGRFEFNATIRFAADGTGIRNGKFRLNGATIYESQQGPAVSTLRSCVLTCNRKIVCAAGDYVEVMAEHTAGGALDAELYEFSATRRTR